MTTAPIRHGIVAGIDGSDSAMDAARWAAGAAQRFDEPLHLTHLLPKTPKSADGTSTEPEEKLDDQLLAEGDELLDAAEKAVREANPDVAIERSVKHGPPARGLVDLSRTARMLVLGRAGTSEMQSVFLGSDVIRVTNNAKCPVAVWRGTHAPDDTASRPVVVGVDGSKLSDLAVAHAFEFAAFFEVPLIAVHCWREVAGFGGYSEARRFSDLEVHEQRSDARLAERLAGWGARYPDVKVTRSVERVGPNVALLEHTEDAQLVVVGSHGRSPFVASLIGSTSQSLIHHALCPVLVCREG